MHLMMYHLETNAIQKQTHTIPVVLMLVAEMMKTELTMTPYSKF
jgi:hypothetical protein